MGRHNRNGCNSKNRTFIEPFVILYQRIGVRVTFVQIDLSGSAC